MQNSTKADHETIQEALFAIFKLAAISVRLAGYLAISWCRVVDEMDRTKSPGNYRKTSSLV